jgi:hypothetical protein
MLILVLEETYFSKGHIYLQLEHGYYYVLLMDSFSGTPKTTEEWKVARFFSLNTSHSFVYMPTLTEDSK